MSEPAFIDNEWVKYSLEFSWKSSLLHLLVKLLSLHLVKVTSFKKFSKSLSLLIVAQYLIYT